MVQKHIIFTHQTRSENYHQTVYKQFLVAFRFSKNRNGLQPFFKKYNNPRLGWITGHIPQPEN